MNAGLVSAGRVFIVTDIVVAALLLSRRATLFVWLGGAAGLMPSGLAFAGRPPAEVVDLARRLTDPSTLLTSGTLTLILGATAAIGVASLVGSLAQSLRATEQALAERDQINTALEQRVAERTHALIWVSTNAVPLNLPQYGAVIAFSDITTQAAPAALPAGPANEALAAPGRLRMLLAEDNPINQEVLRRLLESLGHTPAVVANGAEALDAVARQPYDVVLMDIQMPELDGEAATRHIRALDGIVQPYIIALTASAVRGDRERYLAAGMDDYLSKPVQREDLHAALARASTRGGAGPATPLDPEPADSLVDWAMLDLLIESIGGTPEQAAALVLELFCSTLANQMVAISAAVAADERPRVQLLAHKLRGGSRQLGAIRLADDWMALETAAQREDAALAAILDHAQHVYDETLELLTARLAPPEA